MQLCKDYNGNPIIPAFEAKPGVSFLGVVPVRGGSKGLKGKNMRLLGGKPLYRWVAEAARTSGVFYDIVVCSDWEELLDDAAKCGFSVLHRPLDLATDISPVADTMAWICKVLGPTVCGREHPPYIQLLQATSPLLKPKHIQDAATLIQMWDADVVVGLTPSQDPTAFTKLVPKDWSLRDWYPEEFRNKRRQDFPQTWGLNGYIYLAKWAVWAEKQDWWKTNIRGYPMTVEDNIDINSKEDFEYAEWQLKRQPSTFRSICSFIRELFTSC
jgi:CMP-N,N'-diacetyllegionaminic acid synthase